jgi:hypothetical protein
MAAVGLIDLPRAEGPPDSNPVSLPHATKHGKAECGHGL